MGKRLTFWGISAHILVLLFVGVSLGYGVDSLADEVGRGRSAPSPASDLEEWGNDHGMADDETSFRLRFSLYNRTQISDREYGNVANILLDYNLTVAGFYFYHCRNVEGFAPGPDFDRCYHRQNDTVDESFRQTIHHDSNYLRAVQTQLDRNFTESDLRILRAFDRVVFSKSEAELYQWAKTSGAELSNAEFIVLVQTLGEQLLTGYDKRRSRRSIGEGGSTSVLSMLQAARHNSVLRNSGNPTEDMKVWSAGVCRDISSFQGQLLKQRGFKDTYLITGSTSGSYHTVVLTRDPQDRDLYYQFNYGSVSTRRGGEGPALSFLQDGDNAFNYRIYRPAGGQVANIPSELGKLVEEALGFDLKISDPLAKKSAQFIEGKHQFGRRTALRVVAAQDMLGNNYGGSTIHHTYVDNAKSRGDVGVGILYQYRPGDVYSSRYWETGKNADGTMESHRKPRNEHATYLVAMWAHHWDLATKQIVEGLAMHLRLEAQAIGSAVFTANSKGDPGEFGGQGDGRVGLEYRIQYVAPSGAVHSSVSAKVVVSPGLTKVTDLHALGVMVDYVVFETDHAFRIGKGTLTVNAQLITNPVADRAEVSAGWVQEDWAAFVGWRGSVDNDSVRLFEGTLPTAFLSLGVSWLNCRSKIDLGLVTIETNDEHPLNLTTELQCGF